MPIIRNIIQPIIRPIISGITGAIRRVFITLDPVANAYYELASPWTPSGDFELEFDFVTNSSSTEMTFLGKDADVRGFIRLSNGIPSINWSAASTQNSFGATDYRDGLLHSAKVTLASGTVEFIVDGVSQGAVTPADVSNTNFNVIGAKNGGAYFDGIISNVKLTDLSTPSNSESYALNQLTGNTETSNGNTLTYVNIAETIDVRDTFTLVTEGWTGSELVVNGNFDTDLSGWDILNSDATHNVTWVDGKAEYSSDTTSPQLIFRQVGVLTAGNNYLFKVFLDITSGDIKTSGDFSTIILNDGLNSNTILATNTVVALTRNSNNVLSLIDNVSAKQLIEVA